MRHCFLLLFCSLFLCQCTEPVESLASKVEGRWRLVEVLIDPGDGSGEFETTEMDISLEFQNEGIVIGNGILCGFGESIALLQGEYTQDSLILTNCSNGLIRNRLSLRDGTLVIWSLHCREPCIARLERI